jgi:hypothetical protein
MFWGAGLSGSLFISVCMGYAMQAVAAHQAIAS